MELITRLEEVLLMSIWRLNDNAYGVTINKEVSERAKKKYSMGALYFSLDQLHKKGLVTKDIGSPTPERGGRSKIFYLLTPTGKEALQYARQLQDSLWYGIPKLAFTKK